MNSLSSSFGRAKLSPLWGEYEPRFSAQSGNPQVLGEDLKLWLDAEELGHIPHLGLVYDWNSKDNSELRLQSDGSTSNRREEWDGQDVAGVPITILVENLVVPASNPSDNQFIAYFGSDAGTTINENDSLQFRINSSGVLVVTQRGNPAASHYRLWEYSNFVTDYGGTTINRMALVIEPGTAALVCVADGVDISGEFSFLNNGTPPDWMEDTDTTKFMSGKNWDAGDAPTSTYIIGALSDAEAITWSVGEDDIVLPVATNGTSNRAYNTFNNATTTGFHAEATVSASVKFAGWELPFSVRDGMTINFECDFAYLSETATVQMTTQQSSGVGTELNDSGERFHLAEGANVGSILLDMDDATPRIAVRKTTSVAADFDISNMSVSLPNQGQLPDWAQVQGDVTNLITGTDYDFSGAGNWHQFGGASVTVDSGNNELDVSFSGGGQGVELDDADFDPCDDDTTFIYTFEIRNYSGSGGLTKFSGNGGQHVLSFSGNGFYSITVTTTDDRSGIHFSGDSGCSYSVYQPRIFKARGLDHESIYSRGSSVVNSTFQDKQGTLTGLHYGKNDAYETTNPPKMLQHEQKAGVPKALRLPAVADNYIWRDRITLTSFRVVQRVAVEDIVSGSNQTLWSQWNNTTSNQSILVGVDTAGKFRLTTSTNGTGNTDKTSSSAVVVRDREIIVLAYSFDSATGDVQFLAGPSEDALALVDTATYGASRTPHDDASLKMIVGATETAAANPTAARYFFNKVYSDAAGTNLVSHIDFSDVTSQNQTTVLDKVDNAVWTLRRSHAHTVQDENGVLATAFTGTAGDYVSAPQYIPSSGVFRGEIVDIRNVDFRAGTTYQIVGTYNSSGAQRAWQVYFSSTYKMQMHLSSDGNAGSNYYSTINIPETSVGLAWDLDLDNDTLDYYYREEGGGWQSLGSQVTSVTEIPFASSTANLNVGAHNEGATTDTVGIFNVKLYQDGTQVFDSTPQTLGATEWDDDVSSNTVTVYQQEYAVARFEFPFGDHVYLGGHSNEYISSDHTTIASDGVAMAAFLTIPDTTPSVDECIVSKWIASSGKRAALLQIKTNGRLEMEISTGGGGSVNDESTAAPPWTPNSPLAVGCWWDDGTNECKFYYSFDEGANWSQLGDTVTISSAGIDQNSSNWTIGAINEGTTQNLAARVAWVKVMDDWSSDPFLHFRASDGHGNSDVIDDAVNHGSLFSSGVPANGTPNRDYDNFTDLGNGFTVSEPYAGQRALAAYLLQYQLPAGMRFDVEFDAVNRGVADPDVRLVNALNSSAIQSTTDPSISYDGHHKYRMESASGTGDYLAFSSSNNDADYTITNVTCTLVYEWTINRSGTNPIALVTAPLVRFDASNDYLNFLNGVTSIAQPIHIMSAARLRDSDSRIVGGDDATDVRFGRDGSDQYDLSATSQVDDGVCASTLQIFDGLANGASSEIRADEVEIDTGDVGVGDAPTYVGRHLTTYSNLDLNQLIIASKAMSDTERANLALYAVRKVSANITI